MFPLRDRQIGGYEFGEKTWYTAHHLGTDYKADCGTQLYMPFEGTVTRFEGVQGGLTAWIKPDDQDIIIRLMHLQDMTAGHFLEGSTFATTGNSGSATTGCHLHIDISKGNVDINNFSNFINPEEFNWKGQPMPCFADRNMVISVLKNFLTYLYGTLYGYKMDAGRIAAIEREADIIANSNIDLAGWFKGQIAEFNLVYMKKKDCKPTVCPPVADCTAAIKAEQERICKKLIA